jgi:sec-independent protein translocase protein TatB
MNIFSNIGITELIVILLLALLVVGPERLPEMGRTLAKTLRDLRKAYDNLTKDLGPELMSLQETTQELRESVDSITSIPKDVVDSVVKAADLDDTVADMQKDLGSLQEVGRTVSGAGKMLKDPVGAAVDTARGALLPTKPDEEEPAAGDPAVDAAFLSEADEAARTKAEEDGAVPTAVDSVSKAASPSQPPEPVVVEEGTGTEQSSQEVERSQGGQEEQADD